MSDLTKGASSFIEGFKLLGRPGLRIFIIVPLLVNVILFSGLVYLAADQFDDWVQILLNWLPDWLSFLDWLLWPVFALTIVIMLFFSFTMVANLIAAPFNGILSEVCERQLREDLGKSQEALPFSWKEISLLVPRTLAREITKLIYIAPRALLLFFISLIPGLNLISPVLWALFGAWVMAIQYVDYPADNNQMKFKDMLSSLQRRRWMSLGFGGCVSLLMLVPIINLLIMPAAVTGATRLWVIEGIDQEKSMIVR